MATNDIGFAADRLRKHLDILATRRLAHEAFILLLIAAPKLMAGSAAATIGW